MMMKKKTMLRGTDVMTTGGVGTKTGRGQYTLAPSAGSTFRTVAQARLLILPVCRKQVVLLVVESGFIQI
jgi:hypothetical protein